MVWAATFCRNVVVSIFYIHEKRCTYGLQLALCLLRTIAFAIALLLSSTVMSAEFLSLFDGISILGTVTHFNGRFGLVAGRE